MMDATEGFTWTCPAGHEVYATFTVAELGALRRAIADQEPVVLHCLCCGINHRAAGDLVGKIQVWLEHVAKRRR